MVFSCYFILQLQELLLIWTLGSLNDFVTLNPYEIPLKTKVYLMIGAAKGIRFLHDKSIIHRDIKTQNFMV